MLGLEPINWLGDRSWIKVAISHFDYLALDRPVDDIFFDRVCRAFRKSYTKRRRLTAPAQFGDSSNITVPMLRPIILFVSILVLLSSIQIFDEIHILTGWIRRTGQFEYEPGAVSIPAWIHALASWFCLGGWHGALCHGVHLVSDPIALVRRLPGGAIMSDRFKQRSSVVLLHVVVVTGALLTVCCRSPS